MEWEPIKGCIDNYMAVITMEMSRKGTYVVLLQ